MMRKWSGSDPRGFTINDNVPLRLSHHAEGLNLVFGSDLGEARRIEGKDKSRVVKERGTTGKRPGRPLMHQSINQVVVSR